MNIPILKELERLKTNHATAKVKSSAFQPDEKDQKELIIKNGQRREEEKRLMESRLKEADRKLKDAEKLKNQLNAELAVDMQNPQPDRAQTAPSSSSSKLSRSKSFAYSVDEERPQTSVSLLGGEKSSPFDTILKTANGHFSENLKQQVDLQSRDSKKIFESVLAHFKTGGVGCHFSVKRDFEVIDINSVLATNTNNSRAASSSMGTVKLEDLQNSMKKKDGMALLFDPTISTGGEEVHFRVYFQRAVDLVTEESCSRDFSFFSDGNYFALQLTDETGCILASKAAGQRSTSDFSPLQGASPFSGNMSPVAPRSPTDSPAPPSSTKKSHATAASASASASASGNTITFDNMNIPSKGCGEFKSISDADLAVSSSGSCSSSRQKGCSLPGWQGRPPIFIPSTRCSIEILHSAPHQQHHQQHHHQQHHQHHHHQQQHLLEGATAVASPSPGAVASSSSTCGGGVAAATANASTAYNLSKLRIFAVSAPSARAAAKKLHDFCSDFFVSHTANLTVAGGISALNLAALHGNLEGVKELVESGANINARSRGSKNHTALHEAVIGGHKDVAKYLLDMGANQLLRDEIGYAPLHHACRLENIALARVLIEADSGKRALLLHNNSDERPIELCTSNFMKIRIEGAMRKLKIFVKPRVSILER